ncbi:hypothetical protein KDL01_37575, partial [Actinospica durhamensis]
AVPRVRTAARFKVPQGPAAAYGALAGISTVLLALVPWFREPPGDTLYALKYHNLNGLFMAAFWCMLLATVFALVDRLPSRLVSAGFGCGAFFSSGIGYDRMEGIFDTQAVHPQFGLYLCQIASVLVMSSVVVTPVWKATHSVRG